METKRKYDTLFIREANEGTATDITFDAISADPIRELDTLLTQGKIIAYGYTTLLPY
jgi:hypothetical protein